MNKLRAKQHLENGFSLIELVVVMTILLIALSIVSTILSSTFGTRQREKQKTDALTSVHAALNVMSREIGNSGYGINGNGIELINSNQQKIHFRANVQNDDLTTDDAGEEIIYYYDANIESVVRFDRFAAQTTSIVINRVSNVTFEYFNYSGSSSVGTQSSTPTTDTGRIRITLTMLLDNVVGQTAERNISTTTEVTLRNSNYMLNQY